MERLSPKRLLNPKNGSGYNLVEIRIPKKFSVRIFILIRMKIQTDPKLNEISLVIIDGSPAQTQRAA